MSDKVKGFVVTMEQEVREDESEDLSRFISSIRGVLSVVPVPSDGLPDCMTKERVRLDLMTKIWKELER